MAFAVIAEPPEAFNRWLEGQIEPAPAPTTPELERGRTSVEFRCGSCHAVRGTAAGGSVAPDITHLMSRSMIAGGVVPNTIANLSAWIVDPQAIKPGTRMPVLNLSGPEMESIRTYLATLK